jgi:hypothetical protein
MRASKPTPARKGKFTIHDLTWGVGVTFLIGYNSKYVERYLTKAMGSAPEDVKGIDQPSCTGRTYWRNSTTFFIYLKHWPTKAWHYGILQHELFHVVDQSLRAKGIKLSDDSDEAYAYFTQHLTMMTYQKLWKAK